MNGDLREVRQRGSGIQEGAWQAEGTLNAKAKELACMECEETPRAPRGWRIWGLVWGLKGRGSPGEGLLL